MKIIVFSDSHGDSESIRKALSIHRNADVAIFLGDGLTDFLQLKQQFPLTAFMAVRGNGDIGYMLSDVPLSDSVTLEGMRIFFCHGHTYAVKSGTGVITAMARAKEADIALFGHTHVPVAQYLPEEDGKKALYLVNPGSIGARALNRTHSYALIEIRGNGVLISHGKM